MSRARFLKGGIVYLSVLLLAACGGGGGGASTPTPPPVSTNNAPVLATIGDQSIAEGATSVVTASATDSDGDSLSYTLSGSDAAQFSITNSGELSFLSAPDYEIPSDVNSDNVYVLTVSVSDGSASDSESIEVTVTDVFDGRVVDGPISGAEVTVITSGDTTITDNTGYFAFPSLITSAGQQMTVSGGTDSFTGNALPDLFLTATIIGSDAQSVNINAITTVLARVSANDEAQQVLSSLGVDYSPSDFGKNDIWALAEDGDTAAENAQRVNFQLAVLFQTLQVVVGDGAGVSASDVTLAAATAVSNVALSSEAPLSLAREAVLRDVIADTILSLAQTIPSATVLDPLVAALADANTILSDNDFAPTSELARGATSAVQTAFQSAVNALIADGGTEDGRTTFENDASPSTLFSGVTTGGNTSDIDEDGLVDLLDADDDGDNIRDGDDLFPTDGSETTDNDGDGIGDNADTDDDNDNVLDVDDAFPFDASESLDTDADGVGNNADTDDDGDGVVDDEDDFPLDASETTDSDGDGVGDNGDVFPADPNETADSDGDGVGDNGDAFPADPNETVDSDDDGVGDNGDAFPADPNETVDSDGDGVGDNGDAFPNNPAETVDTDGDGVGDNGDAFPSDPEEQLDTDGDGVGNNADPDDDGDGVNDEDDTAPLDPDISGFFVSGQLSVNPDVVLDSDTNNENNVFARNNVVGNFSPDAATAQPISSPFILHGYVNKPQAGPPGPLFNEGDDDDFFVVDALAGQRFVLKIPDPAQDLDFYLFDANGTVVAASENPPGFVDSEGFQEVMTAPEDGTYYLNIYAYSFQGFPTASNYTVTTDFAGRVSAQSAVRAGEVIVSLKTGQFETAGARADGFSALSARHSLQPATQSRGQYRLMRSATKSTAAKFGSGHAKFSAMANDALRARSEVAHLIKALKADPDVEHAEPNFIYQRHATTNDPLLSQMWHLENINVSNAWDTTTGDPSVVVAVIDGGVLAQHPDFLGQNSEGYDFISSSGNYDGDGIDPDPEDVTPLDDPCSPDGQAFYHGAHVAGTVGATGNNEEGIVGISYGASLMHLRALDGDCGGSSYDIGQSVLYAIGAPNDSGAVPNTSASVVNMSLGGDSPSNFFQEIVNEAASRGVIVVASSGNEGGNAVSYPAAYDNVIAVGATGLDGNLASYSNKGPRLDVVAPGGGNGGSVLSLMKTSEDFTYVGSEGTSMSSPHAAGIFALMKSVHPSLNTARLEAFLEAGVLTDDLGDSGFDNATGWGLLKADKAVAVATADANGTFVFPARLLLSSSRLYFDGDVSSTVITARNPGDVGLSVNSIDNDAPWLSITERSDAGADEIGRWDVSVDAADLTPGFYSTVVTYNAVDDEGGSLVARVTVSLRVGKLTGGDVGSIDVMLQENGTVIATTNTTVNDDYVYRLGVPVVGSYTITASTDTDGDQALCTNGEACGRLGGVETPVSVNLSGARSDLDITVSLPSGLE